LHLTQDGDGTTDEFKDSTINGIAGTGGGGDSTETPTVSVGKIGLAQKFDGVNDYIDFNDHLRTLTYNSFSFHTWYKSENLTVGGPAQIDDEYIFSVYNICCG